MKKIQLFHTESINIFLLVFFAVPAGVYFLDRYSEGNDLNLSPDGLKYFLPPTIVLGILHLPFFRFKESRKVQEKDAILKLPFKEFIFWALAGILAFASAAGATAILNPDPEPHTRELSGAIVILLPLLAVLNSNRILFVGDYLNERDKKELERRQTTEGHFFYTDDGFRFNFQDVRSPWNKKILNFESKWDELEGIMAYKSDNFSYDTVHLVLKKMSGEEMNINEDMDGYFVFKEKLKKNLSGINPIWDLEVIAEPFAENITKVYIKGENLNQIHTS